MDLVVFDLDGTLLNSAKEVTDTTVAILRAARQEAGVHIVLATARPPRSVMPTYNLLELDTPMINYNGALVYEPPSRRILLHRPLAAKIVRGIGKAEIVTNTQLLKKYWQEPFRFFFPKGPSDPDYCLLKITPKKVEYLNPGQLFHENRTRVIIKL